MKAKNKPDRKTRKDAVLAPEQKMLRVLKNHLKDLAVTTCHVNELVNRLREVGVTTLPDIRSRTVLRNYKLSTACPELALSGRWFERTGFESGQRVNILATNSLLVIYPQEVSQPEQFSKE